ncbi:MAG TPA: A24 family peptidase [Candidatus Sulfomarinibacteraceae bacterium]|nr:A24 family peptidase [Candidatus Sulfomarinibacteraceae bacterium]
MLSVLFATIGFLAAIIINVLADDLPARERPARPRCVHCGRAYRLAEWSALARRLVGGGRCAQCDLATRPRALLVEIVTPLMFAALPLLIGRPADLIFAALYVAILILIIVIDIEHRLILHVVTLPSTLLALVGSFFISSNAPLYAVAGAAFGFAAFFFLYWLGRRLFGPGALGFGDVTLSMTMGAMLGFPYIVFALVIGVLLGGLISLALIVTGRLTLRSSVAYGPFLAMAGIITVLWGEQILKWYIS